MITLQNVSKSFGPALVLDRVDLQVGEGEFVAVVGPSGCGKTTLLRIVAGLEPASHGKVLINGHSPGVACRQHLIGVAFQKAALVASRTASANVSLTLEVTGIEPKIKPDQLLATFGINGGSQDKYPHQLSGGMQQRVDLACALVHNPKVLLLDEPFGPLDEITREQMGEWLCQVLTNTGKTILFVTHSVEEAVLLSDRVVVFSPQPGKIVGTVSLSFPRPRERCLRNETVFLAKTAEVRRLLYRSMNGEGNS